MPKKSNVRRKDGRIAVQVYLGTEDGKKRYKTVYGETQKEAEQKANEIREARKHGLTVSGSKQTFSIWADRWLAAKQAEVSDDQYALICSRVRLFDEQLGNADISSIRSYDLQRLIGTIAKKNPYTGKPSAKNTLRSYKQIITAIFDYAVENRAVSINPAKSLKLPQDASEKHRHALSPEERQMVIDFDHRARTAAMLMMFAGLRRGEVTALRWSDVDFENQAISISKSYNFKQNDFKSPKNGKSRIVYIPTILSSYLSSLPHDADFIVTTAHGKLMTDTAWKRMWDSYLYCLNLEYGRFSNPHVKFEPKKVPLAIRPFSPHDLRHTYCTMLYEAGIDVLTAKEQMVHSDVKTTLGIYTHLDSTHKHRSMERLDALYREA